LLNHPLVCLATIESVEVPEFGLVLEPIVFVKDFPLYVLGVLLPWISQTVLKQLSKLPVLLACPTGRGHMRACKACNDVKDSGVAASVLLV
jgi:hypothetical protein